MRGSISEELAVNQIGVRLTRKIQRDALWHGEDGVSRNNDVLRHAASPPTEADEAILVAAIDQSVLTRSARAVVQDGLNGHSVSRLDVRDVVADLFHRAAKFVTQRHGQAFLREGMWSLGDDTSAPQVFMKIYRFVSADSREMLDGTRSICGHGAPGNLDDENQTCLFRKSQ